MLKRSLLISIIFFVLISCTKRKEKETTTAFYYWRSTLDFSQIELNYLEKMKVEKLYIKVFDVDWDMHSKQAVPMAVMEIDKNLLPDIEVIPTIFITNKTLLQLDDSLISDLAKRITTKLLSICQEINFKEIQLDCDWTERTRKKYFQLIECIKLETKDRNFKFSATIRLHQVKYFKKTKVPPVDRGMLMFYNMGDLDDPKVLNSILDIETAESYMVNFEEYPLKLDVALPLFSWGVIRRKGRIIKLINNLRDTDLIHDNKYLEIEKNRFKVLKSHYLEGYYLYRNDKIRLESVSIDKLEEAAKLLEKEINNNDIIVSFFHLDEKCIKFYDYERLKMVCDYFN